MLNMPMRIFQPDANQINHRDYYTISWHRANSEFGTFRCDPLKDNVGQGKREVMNVIRAAYRVKLRSFQACIDFCREKGIEISRYTKGDCQCLTAA
jgi:hypothetical protein